MTRRLEERVTCDNAVGKRYEVEVIGRSRAEKTVRRSSVVARPSYLATSRSQ
jgi:hypothetical protein